MPQLNPEFYISQIFWLIIVFGLIYLFIAKVFIPKIGAVVNLRNNQITNDIAFSENVILRQKELEQEALTIIEIAKRNGFEIIENASKKAELQLFHRISLIERDIGTKAAKEEEKLARFKSQLEANLKSMALDLKKEILDQIIDNLQLNKPIKSN